MFQLGNKLATGGARPGAGRMLRQEVRGLEKAAARLKRQIARHSKKIGETYLGLATGQPIKTKNGLAMIGVDPSTTRHAVEYFLPRTERHEYVGDVDVHIIFEGRES